jgi:iron(II)-dependent oxidoreductase
MYPEAGSYCSWRHRDGGRLPTEEEWEAAARGKDARAFPWGQAAEMGKAVTASSQRSGPAPVGYASGRTPEGVRDLIGNVWEWTSSRYAAYPGGKPMATGGETYYVVRGGAYNTQDQFATTTLRGAAKPTTDNRARDLGQTGFRCVMPVRQAAH